MLNTFRNYGSSLAAKILLGLLVITFSAWGIGDMIRNPARKLTVATVGQDSITNDVFAGALRREGENLKQSVGEDFTPEMLKDPRIAHHVLLQLVNNSLLHQESEALGLLPSDADVVRKIRTRPEFQDEKGNFSKALFENILKNGNMTEKAYVEIVRQEMANNLLIDTLNLRAPVLDIEAKTLLAAREEGRTISIYTLKPSLITDVPLPSDAQIKEYYDSHGKEFTAPEYRTLSYVTIKSEDVSKDFHYSEDELKAIYKERQEEFKRTERRSVEQLLYTSEDNAKKASELLKAGKSFEDVGKETNILNKNSLALGKLEKSNMIENAADKVFSMQKGEVTDPIQSPFGWHIFRVVDVEQPSVASFEEVRPKIEKELAAHSGDKALNDLANKFQDALAGGSSLAEVARDNKLKVLSVGPIDAKGNTPENIKATDLPDLDRFLETSFKTEDKSESAMITSKGGIYYIVRVEKLTPERLRSLDEVKGLLATGWQKQERDKRLAELAVKIGDKFVSAADRNAIKEKYKLQPVKTATIKRSAHAAGDISLPSALVADVFAHKVAEGSKAYQTKSGDYLLAVVDSIIPAPLPENDPKMVDFLLGIRKTLESYRRSEILQEYAHFLSKKYIVTVHEPELQSVLR